MEYIEETHYRINVIKSRCSKDNSDIKECYCKNTSEVVDLVYHYLNKFDAKSISEISIQPETIEYYKKGTI